MYLEGFDYTCRIAGSDGVGRDIAGNDTTGSNRTVVTNRDAGEDSDIAANPDTVAYRDRLSPFAARIALDRIGAMTSRIDADIRATETIVANSDQGFVKDSKMEIGEEPFAKTDMLAVVAVERLVDERIGIRLTEHLL